MSSAVDMPSPCVCRAWAASCALFSLPVLSCPEQSRVPNINLQFLGFISPFSHFPMLADFQRAAQQQEDQEQKDEESEENALHRMREWDDWKDTHPRGYGNRQNMG